MTAWIKVIQPEEASGKLKETFAKVQSPHGTVDNVMKVHSLRPDTMLGHLALYESILHNEDMTLPVWLLEVIASYVSILNECEYSLTHHFSNARRLIDDEERSSEILKNLRANLPQGSFSGKELAMLSYAARLTRSVSDMTESDIVAMRESGCSDSEILEVNQVVAYFNYSNRVLNGLGVTTDGDVVGYYN